MKNLSNIPKMKPSLGCHHRKKPDWTIQTIPRMDRDHRTLTRDHLQVDQLILDYLKIFIKTAMIMENIFVIFVKRDFHRDRIFKIIKRKIIQWQKLNGNVLLSNVKVTDFKGLSSSENHRQPHPGTDRCHLVGDFQIFLCSGPIRSEIFKFFEPSPRNI